MTVSKRSYRKYKKKGNIQKAPVVWFDDSYPFKQMLIIDLKSVLLVILNSYIEIFVFVYKNACIFFKMTQFVLYFNVIFNKMIIENQQIHWFGLSVKCLGENIFKLCQNLDNYFG